MLLWVCLTCLNRGEINFLFCFVSLFLRAHSLSPMDHLAAFYLALQLAISRQVSYAFKVQHHAVIQGLELVSVDE